MGLSCCGTGRGRNGNAGDGLQAKKQTVQREKRGEERGESWKKMTERMKEGRDKRKAKERVLGERRQQLNAPPTAGR